MTSSVGGGSKTKAGRSGLLACFVWPNQERAVIREYQGRFGSVLFCCTRSLQQSAVSPNEWCLRASQPNKLKISLTFSPSETCANVRPQPDQLNPRCLVLYLWYQLIKRASSYNLSSSQTSRKASFA